MKFLNFLKNFYLLLAVSALIVSCNDDEEPAVMVDAGTISGGPFSFFVDGNADFVSGITTDGTGVGSNQGWVITDDQNNILGLPGTIEMLEGVDFDGAGVGRCFIWYIRYEDGLTGLTAGSNTDDLSGNFDLSNSITVDRLALEGATLSGGPFNFIVDGTADNIPEGGITMDAMGTELDASGWVITDLDGNILGLPPTFTAPDFDGAGAGVCQVWYISYETGLTGLAEGNNVSDLEGVYALSNAINVNRLDAPTLAGGPFTFMVGDGTADNIPEGAITMDGGFALENQSSWVITDEEGNILGLPPMFTAPDFDGAGEGLCLVWYITYAEGLTGLEVDNNVSGLSGVYELSNSIDVNRVIAPVISGGPFDFIVDGTADNLGADDITLDNSGTDLGESGWVVTDTQGNILGLPPTFTAPEFDAAGSGTCLVWYITYEAGLTGLATDMNTADLDGVYALSNAVTVNRLDAPTLAGGPFNFTVGDGTADNIPADGITVTGGFSVNDQSSWVITDEAGTILGLPGAFTDVDFDGAGAGSCFVWYITYGSGLTGLTVNENVSGLSGVYELSNSIEVVRTQ